MVRETVARGREEQTRGGDKGRNRGGWGGDYLVWSPVVLAHGELVFRVFIIGNVVIFVLF